MIAVYAALAIAALNLPFSLGRPEPIRTSVRFTTPAPKLDLPAVERLEIVIPQPQKRFDDTLPHFIDQPTPVLKLIVPRRQSNAQIPRSRPPKQPAAPTKLDRE